MSGSKADILKAGGVLVAIGSALMTVGTAEASGPHQSVWHSSWFVSGCAILTLGAVLAIASMTSRFRRRPIRPLHLKVINEGDWVSINDIAWVFALEVSFKNNSARQVILKDAFVTPDPGPGRGGPLPAAVLTTVQEEKAKLVAARGTAVFDAPVVIPVGGQVVRWLIGDSYVPVPAGGRPACTVTVRDSLGDTHELKIPARPSRVYLSREP